MRVIESSSSAVASVLAEETLPGLGYGRCSFQFKAHGKLLPPITEPDFREEELLELVLECRRARAAVAATPSSSAAQEALDVSKNRLDAFQTSRWFDAPQHMKDELTLHGVYGPSGVERAQLRFFRSSQNSLWLPTRVEAPYLLVLFAAVRSDGKHAADREEALMLKHIMPGAPTVALRVLGERRPLTPNDPTSFIVQPGYAFALVVRVPLCRADRGWYGAHNPNIAHLLETLFPSTGVELASRKSQLCASCGSKGFKPLRSCAGCGTVHYCSEACQKADWPTHKAACKEARRLRKAASPEVGEQS